MWELWSSDLFDREAAPHLEYTTEDLQVGLAMLWSSVLRQGVQDDGRPTFTSFRLRSPQQAISIPRDPLANPELARLRARLDEPDLSYRLARVHETRLSEPFSFVPYLEVPVELPRLVTEFAVALARVLGRGEALTPVVRGWRCGEAVEIGTDGYQAGTLYESGQQRWRVRVEGFEVTLNDVSEAGWYREVTRAEGAGAAVLRDALVAAGLL